VENQREKRIATQALEALRLHTKRRRGELTEEEYLKSLSLFQETAEESQPADAQRSATSNEGERQKLLSTLDTRGLQPWLHGGPLTPQQYGHVLGAQLEPSWPDITVPGGLVERPPSRLSSIIVTPTSERFLVMKCPCCTANLNIYDRTMDLECSECGTDIQVERKDCTISVRLASTASSKPEALADTVATGDLLQMLKAEESTLSNIRRAAGFLGVICCLMFAHTGIGEIAHRDRVIGAGVLIGASALVAITFCISRHTNKQRAELGARIRALTAACSGEA
jgi:ribosomal protein S27E